MFNNTLTYICSLTIFLVNHESLPSPSFLGRWYGAKTQVCGQRQCPSLLSLSTAPPLHRQIEIREAENKLPVYKAPPFKPPSSLSGCETSNAGGRHMYVYTMVSGWCVGPSSDEVWVSLPDYSVVHGDQQARHRSSSCNTHVSLGGHQLQPPEDHLG